MQHLFPGLAAVAAGVHRQHPPSVPGIPAKNSAPCRVVRRGETRQLWRLAPRLRRGSRRTSGSSDAAASACHAASLPCRRNTAVAHQQIAAQPDRIQRLVGRQAAQEATAGRRDRPAGTCALGRTAGPPAGVFAHRLIAQQLATPGRTGNGVLFGSCSWLTAGARATSRPGHLFRSLRCRFCPSSLSGTPPIDPAPMVTTTSPSRAICRIACGIALCPRRTPASPCPATRTACISARPSAADDGRFAGRIDLRQQQRVDGGQHFDEVLETSRASACSDAAGRPAPGAVREMHHAPPPALRPFPPGDDRSRRSE